MTRLLILSKRERIERKGKSKVSRISVIGPLHCIQETFVMVLARFGIDPFTSVLYWPQHRLYVVGLFRGDGKESTERNEIE